MKVNLQPIKNQIRTHWHGGHGLLVTVVLVLLGLRILLGAIQGLIQRPTNDLLLYTWLALSVVVLVWQVVGGWRACDQYLRSGGELMIGCAGYLAIPVTIILATLQLIDGVTFATQIHLPPVKPVTQLAILDDGASVVIKGQLDWDTHTALTTALKKNASINTVILNSKGGRVFSARGLALVIAQHSLNTHVDEQCLSACTIVFLAGTHRSMGTGAQLGFHQYDMAIPHHIHTIDLREELTKDRRYFVSRGVSEWFVEQVFQADKDSMWKPDQSVLRKEGVLTQRVSTNQ